MATNHFLRFLSIATLGILLGLMLLHQQPDWQFMDDDFGAFWSGKTFQASDLKNYFGYKTNELTIVPSNREQLPMTFFASTYRPLTLLWYAFECWLLKTQTELTPWNYFQLSIWLHVLAAILLGFLISLHCRLWLSLLACAAFLLFPCFAKCVGPFSAQPFSLSLIFLLFASWLLTWAIERQSQAFAVLAVALTLMPILMHELSLFFPLWLSLVAVLQNYNTQKNWQAAVWQSLPVAGTSLLMIGGYLAVRSYLFPLSLEHTQIFNPATVIARLQERIYDFATLLVDFFGLTWLPAKNPLNDSFALVPLNLRPWLKLLAIVGHAGLIGLLWLSTSKKIQVTLLWLATLTIAWPSLLLGHQARYLYPGLAFFIAGIALAAEHLPPAGCCWRWLKAGTAGMLLAWAGFGYFCIGQYLQAICTKQTVYRQGLESLAKNPQLFDHSLFFIGLPHELFPQSGIAQAVRIFGPADQAKRKIVYDYCLNVRSLEVNHTFAKTIDKNLLAIKINPPQISLTCQDPEKLWVLMQNSFGEKFPCTIGKVLNQEFSAQDASKTASISVLVDPQWLENTAFITWDYAQQKFVQLLPAQAD